MLTIKVPVALMKKAYELDEDFWSVTIITNTKFKWNFKGNTNHNMAATIRNEPTEFVNWYKMISKVWDKPITKLLTKGN